MNPQVFCMFLVSMLVFQKLSTFSTALYTYPKELRVQINKDLVYQLNSSEPIWHVRWGLLKADSSHFVTIFFMDYHLNANLPSVYKGRLAYFGDIIKGLAWYKLKNVTLNDGGLYGVRIMSHGYGPIMSHLATNVIVTATPTFTSKPNAVTIITEHKDLSINCSAIGPPTPKVKWINVSNNIPIVNQGNGSAVLNIPNITRHYNGQIYKCQAENNPNEGPSETSTVIQVNWEPALPVLTIAEVQETNVLLRWSKPNSNGDQITHYTVYQKEVGVGEEWKKVHTRERNIKHLKPGKKYSFIVTASNRLGESPIDSSKKQSVVIPVKKTASTTKTFDGHAVNKTSTGHPHSSQTSDSNLAPVIVLGVLFAVSLSLNVIFLAYFILRIRKGEKGNSNIRTSKNCDEIYMNSLHRQDKQSAEDSNVQHYECVGNNKQQSPPNTTIYQSVSPHSDIYSSLSPCTKLPPKPAVMATSGVCQDTHVPSHQYQAVSNARRR